MQKRLTRAEVPAELTWDLTDLFADQAAWESELTAVEAELPRVSRFKGRLGEGAALVAEALNAWESLMIRFMQVATYANLLSSGDGTDTANQANSGRTASLGARVNALFQGLRAELLALPAGTLEGYIASEPALAEFKILIDELLETKPHTLSMETEVALASLGEVMHSPYMIYQRAKSTDISFEPFQDENGNAITNSFALYEDAHERSASTLIRRNAFASFGKGLNAYKNTLAATLATEIKKHVVTARLRKYASATEMHLQPHQVSVEVYNNVLDIIQAELAPHMRRYAALRKRVLGLDKLLYCDIEAPLDPEFDPPTTYAEASELILDSLSVLGPEYTRIMEDALQRRWVDLADNVGKSTGAFCASPYGVHPYILITWTNSMRNVFVLAHELGHAGHFALAQRNQRMVNTRPSMFFVEAPSTINELLLGQHILARKTDPRMRRWVLMQFLGTYHHNFVRHLLEGELQRRIYALAEAGKPLTESTFSSVKGEILSGYWGDAVEIDDAARLTWMRQPHYYMGLYPYTYAAGLTASTAVAQLIREEGQPAVDRWLQALKAGGTLRPLELMKLAGVDMSQPEPIRKAVAYVGSLVDELEKSF